jgi:tetratricopeptide (TPR) repeat protein
MNRRVNGRPVWLAVFAFMAALAIAIPAAAQQGMVKGNVKDEKGQPVEGAKVMIESTGPSGRKMETKTDKKGEFVQVGIPSDNYTITVEKVGTGAARTTTRVTARTAATINLVLSPGARTVSAEEIAKNTALKKFFEAGVAASNSGNMDEAISQFTQASQLDPTCSDCYYNIGYAYSQKKDYDKAEAAYKKAVEIKPDYADAYNGLANIYNMQRKFDLAAEASAKATASGGAAGGGLVGGGGGGGNVNAMYNQGVILWNGGKVAEAKKQFEAVLQADPNHAEAHYQLGMALVNEGNLAGAAEQFESYLKLAPTGPNAATATALLAQLKK